MKIIMFTFMILYKKIISGKNFKNVRYVNLNYEKLNRFDSSNN